MPNIKSAKKRVLTAARKNDENRAARSRMNNAIKKLNAAIDANNMEEANRLLPITMGIIDSTASMGVIHKNNAANKKSGLSKRISDVVSGKVTISIKKDNRTVAAEKAKAAQDIRDAAKKEYAAKAAEKKAAKLEAAKQKLEAEKAAKKAPAKAKKADAKAEPAKKADKAEKAEKAPAKAKKADTEPKAEKADAEKAPAKKATKAKEPETK